MLHVLSRPFLPPLLPETKVFLMNLRVNYELYRGTSEAGIAAIQESNSVKQQNLHSKPALYLSVNEAKLWRHAYRFDNAFAALDQADEIADATNDEGFQPWLNMERAWCMALAAGNLAVARRKLLETVDLQKFATRRSNTFHLAAIDVMEGKWADAKGRLQHVLPEFEETNEQLEKFACQVYLAFVLLRLGSVAPAHDRISQHFEWAEA